MPLNLVRQLQYYFISYAISVNTFAANDTQMKLLLKILIVIGKICLYLLMVPVWLIVLVNTRLIYWLQMVEVREKLKNIHMSDTENNDDTPTTDGDAADTSSDASTEGDSSEGTSDGDSSEDTSGGDSEATTEGDGGGEAA